MHPTSPPGFLQIGCINALALCSCSEGLSPSPAYI